MPKRARRVRAAWQLFAVLAVFRSRATGKPRRTDRNYDPQVTWVEQRVVLVRARSDAEAARVGRNEARRYATSIAWVNPYGQRLSVRVIGLAVWHVLEGIAPGSEVFSSGSLEPRAVSDVEIRRRRFGSERTRRSGRARKMFAPGDVWKGFETDSWWDGPVRIRETGSQRRTSGRRR